MDTEVSKYGPGTAHTVTSGPAFHWFGYYDKLQFSPDGTKILCMQVDFEGRSPEPDDVIRVGMIDLADGNRWKELGSSRSWCWQQGCMLQWVPGTASTVIWNDREGDRFVSRIVDVVSGEQRTCSEAVYTLHPDGATAIAPDFRRINDTRPGYGYCGLPDPNRDVLAPDDAGIRIIDLDTGTSEQVLSIGDVSRMPFPDGGLSGFKHYFNHLLYNPSGSRFVFLHRWVVPGKGFATRMMSARADGSDVRTVDDSGHSSHFHWRDDTHILIFTKPRNCEWGFYLFDVLDGTYELVIDYPRNGHCVYMPDTDWILNDTYPGKDNRVQDLYLYHVPSGKRSELGGFFAPAEYAGEWRCDLHARFSRDGKTICFDSAHGGNGRQLYVMDIGEKINCR